MSFPDYKRVIYRRNPLAEVICQLRFPPILKISSEAPAEFQDRIRHTYPEFQQKKEVSLPQDIVRQLPDPVIQALSSGSGETSYNFFSEDRAWVITLTAGFLALTSTHYESWDDFVGHLTDSIDALIDVYRPSYYTRIGLRYQNLIKKSDWGLEEVQWSELLNPHLTGVLIDPYVGEDVKEVLSQCIISLGEDVGKVKMQHGLVRLIRDGVTDEEPSYLIDNDLFIDEKVEISDGSLTLDRFHEESGRVFNWCITDKFRRIME
jgi:uncharacterized protein (TIGR04255 family)